MVTITYGHGWLSDCNTTTGWVETEDGNVGSVSVLYDDWFIIHITSSSGNKIYYISYPDEGGASNLSLNSTLYTVIYYRYLANGSAKAKIVLVFSDATTQTVLAETTSTAWKTGFAYITSGKTIDHIRFYANQAAGDVYYDFALICMSIFSFPNVGHGLDVRLPPRYAIIPISSRIGDVTQNLGSESATVNVSCDLNRGSWKRSGDYIDGEVFYDIAHNSYQEPFQWLDTGSEQFKVTLETPVVHRISDGRKTQRILDLQFREYSRSSRNHETHVERFGLNL